MSQTVEPPTDAAITAIVQQLTDISDYLAHENPLVREQAIKIIRSFSGDATGLAAIRKLNITSLLLRLLQDTPQIAFSAQTALVNISADVLLSQDLIADGAIETINELLLQCAQKGKSPRQLLMFLTNLTLTQEGVLRLMQEGKEYQGLHALRLFNWFNNEQFVKDEQKSGTDNWSKAAAVIANLSQSAAFRRSIIDPSEQYLTQLQWQLKRLQVSPTDPYILERAFGIFRLCHNIAFDYDKHYYLIDETLLSLLLTPILEYNTDNAISPDELIKIPMKIRLQLSLPNKRYHPNAELRRLSLDLLNVMCRNTPTRKYLRAIGMYYIIREEHKLERELENDEVDSFIDEELIQYFLLDETEEEQDYDIEKINCIARLKRLSQGLTEFEEGQGPIVAKPSQATAMNEGIARIQPTENDDVMDAKKYNEQRAKLHELEEARQNAELEKRKKDMVINPNVLDFLD